MIVSSMIQKTITYSCRVCASTNIVKNGTNRLGQQQYHCKDCGAYRVLASRREAKKTETAHPESLPGTHQPTRTQSAVWDSSSHHCSMDQRACGRFADADSNAVARPADDLLEFDEAWSFVRKRVNKRWLWTVMCRRTRQIVAFVIGDRSEQSCRRLWDMVPLAYRRCRSYSDFWKAYQEVLPKRAIAQSAREVDSYPIWSVGIVHCDKGKPAMSAKRSPFPRAMFTIISSPTGLSSTTTWR